MIFIFILDDCIYQFCSHGRDTEKVKSKRLEVLRYVSSRMYKPVRAV